jgi:hypothetical protein
MGASALLWPVAVHSPSAGLGGHSQGGNVMNRHQRQDLAGIRVTEEPDHRLVDEKVIQEQARRLLNRLVLDGDLKRLPSGKLIFPRASHE